jgi:hypothetical protein
VKEHRRTGEANGDTGGLAGAKIKAELELLVRW